MTKTPLLYLTHILDATTSILTETESTTKEQFEESELIQGFVERKLEIIGEATKCIPDEFKMKYPNVPWKDMAGMRDVLIHQYTEVDEEIVWKTIVQKLPPLKTYIESIIMILSNKQKLQK